MTNNFVKEIERYLLATFSKKEGDFGYKPLMHPNFFSKGKAAHEQLKSEGLIYLENERKEAVASIHPKRGITFVALAIDVDDGMWKVTLNDKRILIYAVDTAVTRKGVSVLGELELREIDNDYKERIYFHTYDEKLCIKMKVSRFGPTDIYARLESVIV